MTLAPFVLMALPIATACYVGEKVYQHRRHWYQVPAGWRLPKVEVACVVSAVGSLAAGAVVLWGGGVKHCICWDEEFDCCWADHNQALVEFAIHLDREPSECWAMLRHLAGR